MKSGARYPLTTKKQEGGGRICPGRYNFSAQSLCCLWVGKWHHFGQWIIGEVNWQCGQAGRANNQSIYLDVYALERPQMGAQNIEKDWRSLIDPKNIL